MESPPRLGLRTINIAPFMEGLIFYQSMCPKFRYEDGKVLDTQPHPICGSASTHCAQVLISLKVGLTCYSNSHTLQLASKANKHGIIIPKPCTHLSQHQTTYPRVETSHGRIKQACYEHPNIQGITFDQTYHVHQLHQAHHSNQCMFM